MNLREIDFRKIKREWRRDRRCDSEITISHRGKPHPTTHVCKRKKGHDGQHVCFNVGSHSGALPCTYRWKNEG